MEKAKQLRTLFLALTITGFALLLGSIASFIAMNVINPEGGADITFIRWQRTFVNPISQYVTVPGMWLFLLGNAGLFLAGDRKKILSIALVAIAALVFMNGMFLIVPLAKEVSSLAADAEKLRAHIDIFGPKKTTEDTLGGINLLLLAAYLVLSIIRVRLQAV